MIQSFHYDDDWYPETDGRGPTLVVVDLAADRGNWDLETGWRESFQSLGSPGGPDLMQGDVNLDQKASLADLAIIQANILTASGATRAIGDLDGDGAVDRDDVAALAANLGRAYPPPPPPSPAAAVIVSESARPTEKRLFATRRRSASADDGTTTQAAIVDRVFSEIDSPLSTTVARRRPAAASR